MSRSQPCKTKVTTEVTPGTSRVKDGTPSNIVKSLLYQKVKVAISNKVKVMLTYLGTAVR